MATQAQISAIADIILNAFESNPTLFEKAMTKLKLQQELSDIQSKIENHRKAYHTATDDFNQALETLQTALNAKQDEINQLVAK